MQTKDEKRNDFSAGFRTRNRGHNVDRVLGLRIDVGTKMGPDSGPEKQPSKIAPLEAESGRVCKQKTQKWMQDKATAKTKYCRSSNFAKQRPHGQALDAFCVTISGPCSGPENGTTRRQENGRNGEGRMDQTRIPGKEREHK